MAFPKDFKDLIELFNKNGVEYLIVGGWAFGIHVEPRATKDLDLFIRPSQKNSEAVWDALRGFGAPLEELGPENFQDGESTIQFGQPPNRIDIIQKIDGVAFNQAWKNRIVAEIDGVVSVSIISREDLLRNKKAAGRPRDLVDAQDIEEADKAMRKKVR